MTDKAKANIYEGALRAIVEIGRSDIEEMKMFIEQRTGKPFNGLALDTKFNMVFVVFVTVTAASVLENINMYEGYDIYAGIMDSAYGEGAWNKRERGQTA